MLIEIFVNFGVMIDLNDKEKGKDSAKKLGFTVQQIIAADYIIAMLNEDFGNNMSLLTGHVITEMNSRGLNFDGKDFRFVTEMLEQDKIIVKHKQMAHQYRLLAKGRDIIQSHKDFTSYLLDKKAKESENEELDKAIKEKTLENLNRSIFKQKHAIWFFAANIVVTVGIALITAFLVFKFGWK